MKLNGSGKSLSNDTLISILPKVSRPARYIGGEVFSRVKSHQDTALSIALAFPDIYEIGMSYPGFQILYHILNSQQDIVAERVFAPWNDMAGVLKTHNLPLFSLETKTSLKSFDIIGFTLQYELTYTNILLMLSLGGIPLRSSERTDDDPIILGGGPCAFNPEPLALFFDAFAIGDGEEMVLEIANAVKSGLKQGLSRREIIRTLSKVPGVYVPDLYFELRREKRDITITPKEPDAPYPIKARILPKLSDTAYPEIPVLPNIKPVQDKLAVEIMRGCTRGCRFCQAGYIYRPTRERNADGIIDQAYRWVRETGQEEVSLISLSSSDYKELPVLMRKIKHQLSPFRTSLAFPSLRSDSFTPAMAEYLKTGGFSGLTLAIEAATPRLRQVINKTIDEEGILESVRVAVQNGWRLVKIYLMIGLPTETEEDLLAIPELLHRIVLTGKCKIHAAVSPFVPKAWTPFQWERQNSIEELNEKITLIRNHLKDRRITLKWQDPRVSWLEGILGRGDRRMGSVIESAFNSGARFDGWAEEYRFDIWQQAFQNCGIQPGDYLESINRETNLPWEHITKGITKEFFLSEREKAYQGIPTLDCRIDHCERCGVMDIKNCSIVLEGHNVQKQDNIPWTKSLPEDVAEQKIRNDIPIGKLRVTYRKEDFAVFLSHLDLGNIFRRVLRWTGLPILWSQGFHPHLRISYGPPLPTGYAGEEEYFDVMVTASSDNLEHIRNLLQSQMPKGIQIITVVLLSLTEKTDGKYVQKFCYRVPLKVSSDFQLEKSIHEYFGQSEIPVTIVKNGTSKTIDIRPFVHDIRYSESDNQLRIELLVREGHTVRVEPVIETLFKQPFKELSGGTIVRTKIVRKNS